MEHTNLFLFEDRATLDAEYPDGEVTTVPGVAYARASENEGYTVLFNKKITNYTVTLQLQDKSGTTLGASVTALTQNILNGETIKYKVVAPEIENYKPRNKEEKINVSGDTTHTIIYLGLTDYTVTVHHVFSGTPITADTEVIVEDVWDESSVRVTIEPVSIPGYMAEPVTITVSGNCEYNLEYEETAYEAIDLGLPSGTKWANMNVGASSPEEYGNYYAWGEIVPNKATAYTMDNYKWYDSSADDMSKYNDTDNKMTLDLEDDAAYVVMGGDWHMPSSAQCAEFLDNTTSSWTTDYNGTGVAGAIFTSNINNASVFFPAAGGVWDKGPEERGGLFNIFCSTRSSNSYNAYSMGGDSDWRGISVSDRYPGFSVRGVLGENPGPGPK